MDIGALVIEDIRLENIEALRGAIITVLRDEGVNVDRLQIAYSAHLELGPNLIVHFLPCEDQDEQELYDPYLFFANLRKPDGIGASISGYMADDLGKDDEVSIIWACRYERRCCFWMIDEGFYYTHEGADYAEDDGPFDRLCRRLGVKDQDLLRQKLELPDTDWTPANTRHPESIMKIIADRLPATKRRSAPPMAHEEHPAPHPVSRYLWVGLGLAIMMLGFATNIRRVFLSGVGLTIGGACQACRR